MKHSQHKNLIWNYVGTIFSMGSSFILLPFLVFFLTEDELGLWYVFLAISNLTQLFEFGFNPTFARNIVYCVNGSKSLNKTGGSAAGESGVDFFLLKTLLSTSKIIFAAIAVVVFSVVISLGSLYVASITKTLSGSSHWIAWGIFCIAIFFNLYYLYPLTYLRGLGDIASENKSKTYAKIAQLAITPVMLMFGLGLVGAALGYLINGIVLRTSALKAFRMHSEISEGLECVKNIKIKLNDIRSILSTLSYTAIRDGLVQFSNFAVTQATSILCSLYLSLAETGQYSVMMQFATAAQNVACIYARTYFPVFQASYIKGDVNREEELVEKGVTSYVYSFSIIDIIIVFIILPVLPLVKPDFNPDYALYVFISIYYFLWNHHSLFCNYIISMNVVPYAKSFVLSAILGLILSTLFLHFGLGEWGLILGQVISLAIYNNWKWPHYVMKRLHTTYRSLFVSGTKRWIKKIERII